jgi:hypothetical protein
VEAAETLRVAAWWRRQEASGRRELRGARSPVECAGVLEPVGGRPLPGGRRPPAIEREAASLGRPDPVEAGVLEEVVGCR